MESRVTVKEYLSQAFRLNELIKTNQEEVYRLRVLAKSIGSPDLSQGRVRSGDVSDKIGNIVAKIVDLDAEINEEIDRYVDLKQEIRTRVNAIEQDDLKLILQKRYLNSEKWEQIAADMNYGYQWIHKLHQKALIEFANKNQQAIESDT